MAEIIDLTTKAKKEGPKPAPPLYQQLRLTMVQLMQANPNHNFKMFYDTSTGAIIGIVREDALGY